MTEPVQQLQAVDPKIKNENEALLNNKEDNKQRVNSDTDEKTHIWFKIGENCKIYDKRTYPVITPDLLNSIQFS